MVSNGSIILVNHLSIDFSNSGGIAELEYHVPPIATEPTTWGVLKRLHR